MSGNRDEQDASKTSCLLENEMTIRIREGKPMFGAPELEALYRRTIHYAVENKIFRICRMEEHSNFKRLLICNVWRIDRLQDGSVLLFEHDLRAGIWQLKSAKIPSNRQKSGQS